MKKEIEYIVRYDDGNKLATMYCINEDNMKDLVDTLESKEIPYMVVKIKGQEAYKLRWLTDCKDLFGGES